MSGNCLATGVPCTTFHAVAGCRFGFWRGRGRGRWWKRQRRRYRECKVSVAQGLLRRGPSRSCAPPHPRGICACTCLLSAGGRRWQWQCHVLYSDNRFLPEASATCRLVQEVEVPARATAKQPGRKTLLNPKSCIGKGETEIEVVFLAPNLTVGGLVSILQPNYDDPHPNPVNGRGGSENFPLHLHISILSDEILLYSNYRCLRQL